MSYYLERIQHGVDYIEARLDEDLELHRIAKEAGLSQWHFQRIFKSLTGETLKTYVRSRRFAKSLELLLSTKLRVLDIAVRSGFESQEAFARAFKKAFGMTPQQYRKLGNKHLVVKKPQFNADYLRHIHHNVSLEPELYSQPQMTLVGLRTQFFGVDSEKNNIGARLPPLWAAFSAPRRKLITSSATPIRRGSRNPGTRAGTRAAPTSRSMGQRTTRPPRRP